MHGDYIHKDDHIALTEEMLKLTRSVGSEVFIIAGSKPHTNDEAEKQLLLERTKKLAGIAEDEGVRLALEFEPDFLIGCTKDLLELMDRIPSPCFGTNLDLGHVFLTDPDPMDSIAALGKRIFYGHIENMPAGKHRHLLPEDPALSMKACLEKELVHALLGSLLYSENHTR